MKTVYGFKKENNEFLIEEKQAGIVKKIFELYLCGYSLGGISKYLEENNILSPTGKSAWNRASIDKMLSNKKYLVGIIAFETYTTVQFEKENRSNTTENKKRKTTRYNSQNVLSGLLVCSCCGKNYRRIARANGDVVWRCADKVENGKKSTCNNKNTILDSDVQKSIFQKSNNYDERSIKEHIEKIIVSTESFAIFPA